MGVGGLLGEEKQYEMNLGCIKVDGCCLPRERRCFLGLRTGGRKMSGMELVLARSKGKEGGDQFRKIQF